MILSLVLIALQGCSTSANIKSDFTYVPGNKGIVFGSVTTSGHHEGWLYIRKKGSEEEIRFTSTGTAAFLLEIRDAPKYGGLFTLDLTPGVYEITKWTLYEFIGGLNIYNYFMPVAVKPIEFEIGSDEAVYLGNFHIDVTMGKTLFFLPVVQTAEGQIHDDYVRDVDLFHKKYPQLNHLKIRKSVPDPELWKGLHVKRKTW
jgi:hypothetical protein